MKLSCTAQFSRKFGVHVHSAWFLDKYLHKKEINTGDPLYIGYVLKKKYKTQNIYGELILNSNLDDLTRASGLNFSSEWMT